jgi:hypothetical protein
MANFTGALNRVNISASRVSVAALAAGLNQLDLSPTRTTTGQLWPTGIKQ